MKIFFSSLLIFFSLPIIADNISDFEIEGISIGDSLLDHFTKEEIIKNQRTNWFEDKDGKFMASGFSVENNSSSYDGINVYYKTNDNNFIIVAIDGHLIYENNINECYSKKEEVFESISNLFIDFSWDDSDYEDELGKFTSIFLTFKSGDRISIQCYDWNTKTENDKNWVDNLRLIIKTAEFNSWL